MQLNSAHIGPWREMGALAHHRYAFWDTEKPLSERKAERGRREGYMYTQSERERWIEGYRRNIPERKAAIR